MLCCGDVVATVPEDDSSRSSLLTSQSNLRENWVQLVLFPRIREAREQKKTVKTQFILVAATGLRDEHHSAATKPSDLTK